MREAKKLTYHAFLRNTAANPSVVLARIWQPYHKLPTTTARSSSGIDPDRRPVHDQSQLLLPGHAESQSQKA